MAVASAGQVTPVYSSGVCEQTTLFSVKDVTTNDTVDMTPYFRVVTQAIWMGATVSGTATGVFSGLILTVPAGLTTAGAWVLVQGVAV